MSVSTGTSPKGAGSGASCWSPASSIPAKDHFLDLGEPMTYPDALAKAQEVAQLRRSERIIV